jgi:hypothetical protein
MESTSARHQKHEGVWSPSDGSVSAPLHAFEIGNSTLKIDIKFVKLTHPLVTMQV